MTEETRNKIIAGIGVTIILIMFSSSFQFSNEQNTLEHKTTNRYTEVISPKPHQGDSNLYTYSVKFCAVSDSSDIADILIQSDIDEEKLGINKIIQKEECTTFGSMMKAKMTETFSTKIKEN